MKFVRELLENISFWGRSNIASWVINNWNAIGWFTFIFTIVFIILNTAGVIWLGKTIYTTEYSEYNQKLQDLLVYISFFLTVLFGFITLLSLFIAVAVLNSLREIIPDYTQASLALQKIIKKARGELFILSINPSFLQVLDAKGLSDWQKELEKKLDQNKNLKVRMSYVERNNLVNTKFIQWAGDLALENTRPLLEDFLNTFIFKTVRDGSYRNNFELYPLRTNNLPFVIAIADNDMAMFCHSIIYPKVMGSQRKNVRKSLMRGVISYDQNIVQAIKEVYYQLLKLNGGAYKYTCDTCGREVYLYDHEIIKYGGYFTVNNLHECPRLSSPCHSIDKGEKIADQCPGKLSCDSHTLEKFIDLKSQEIGKSLYKEITERDWDG